jgi:hypothetical protein
MVKRLTFKKERKVTDGDEDSRSFLFPFDVVAAEFVGTPAEEAQSTQHRLIVRIVNTRVHVWERQLTSEMELAKVLFEIGWQAVKKRVEDGTLEKDHEEMVTTATHLSKLPYDPSRIKEPNGACYYVLEKRRIGFK